MVENYNEVLYDNETLECERIILRKSRKEDAGNVFEYGGDEECTKYLMWNGCKSKEEALGNITNYYWSRPGIFAIELKENSKCIGCIDLRVDADNEKASFGYVLNRQYWGRGYMTEALSALLQLCFAKLDLNRVEATHFVGNEGSGMVMKKCGMRLEGLKIQEIKVKGLFRDQAHYGITKEMWLDAHAK